ncbi:MAG: phytanoyl-CoA dioxygenase family protein [Novosphingobium sp.]|nr:phytanoyl-CoA dioxygenase family protein [Novosphingobium sp.]
MSLTHLPASASIEEASACLAEHGHVIIDSLASIEDLDHIDAELEPWYDAAKFGDSEHAGLQTKRTGALIARSPTARKLIMNPLVLGVVTKALPYMFQLGLTEMVSVWPDSQPQFLHQDQSVLGPYPFEPDYELMITTIWAISEFTEETGATRVVPESHRLGSMLPFSDADAVSAEMPRGSVLILSGRLYHGSGANRSKQVRRGMTIDFIAAWLRQMENQFLSCLPEITRTLPEDLLRLMGYQVTPHSVGRVGDWLDPLSVALGGEDRLNEALLGT